MGPLSSPPCLAASSGQPRGPNRSSSPPCSFPSPLSLCFFLSVFFGPSSSSSRFFPRFFCPVRRFFVQTEMEDHRRSSSRARPSIVRVYVHVYTYACCVGQPTQPPERSLGPKEIIVIYRRFFRIVGYFAVVVPSRVGITRLGNRETTSLPSARAEG